MVFRRFCVAGLVFALLSFVSSCSSTSDHAVTAGDAVVDASIQQLMTAIDARDLNRIMNRYTPKESLILFDAILPRQYLGPAAIRKNWEETLSAFPGGLHAEVSDWKSESDGTLAWGHGIVRMTGTVNGKTTESVLRLTDVFQKIDGKWLVIHEHVSVPVDMTTGKADWQSKP